AIVGAIVVIAGFAGASITFVVMAPPGVFPRARRRLCIERARALRGEVRGLSRARLSVRGVLLAAAKVPRGVLRDRGRSRLLGELARRAPPRARSLRARGDSPPHPRRRLGRLRPRPELRRPARPRAPPPRPPRRGREGARGPRRGAARPGRERRARRADRTPRG